MNKNLSNLSNLSNPPKLNSLKIGGTFSLQKYLSDKITLLLNWKTAVAIIV